MAPQSRPRRVFEKIVSTARMASGAGGRSSDHHSIVADETSVRAFVKWCNFHLSTEGDKVTDLSVDFRDGKRLLKLLEVVSGEKLPRPERASMRIHYIQNVAKSLKYLEAKLGEPLANCSAEDIVDGNVKLTLAMLYQVTRFQLLIAADDPSLAETVDHARLAKKSSKESAIIRNAAGGGVDARDRDKAPADKPPLGDAKASILAWCNSQIAEYVKRGLATPVNDFSASWRSGLAFSALLHRHDRYLLPHFPEMAESLKSGAATPAFALQQAFKAAESYLNIPQLLEPEDLVDVEKPDEKIVLACLTGWYSILCKIQRTPEWQAVDSARWQEADPISFSDEGLRKWEADQEARAQANKIRTVESAGPDLREQAADDSPQGRETTSGEGPSGGQAAESDRTGAGDVDSNASSAELADDRTAELAQADDSEEGPTAELAQAGKPEEGPTAELAHAEKPEEGPTAETAMLVKAPGGAETGVAEGVPTPAKVSDDPARSPRSQSSAVPSLTDSPPGSETVQDGESDEVDAVTRELVEWVATSEELRAELAAILGTATSLLEVELRDAGELRSLHEDLSSLQKIIASAAQDGRDLLAQNAGNPPPPAHPPFDDAAEKTIAYVRELDADYAAAEEIVGKLRLAIQLQPVGDSPAPGLQPSASPAMPATAPLGQNDPKTAPTDSRADALRAPTANQTKSTAGAENPIFTPSKDRVTSKSGSGIVIDGWIASAEALIEDCEVMLKEQRAAALDLVWRPAAIDKRPLEEKDARCEAGVAEAADFHSRCESLGREVVVALNEGRKLLAQLEGSAADDDLVRATLVESVVQRLESAIFMALKGSREYSRLPTQTRAARHFEDKARKFFHAVRSLEPAIASVPVFRAEDADEEEGEEQLQLRQQQQGSSSAAPATSFSFSVYEALRSVEIELEQLESHFGDLKAHRCSITPLSKSVVLLSSEAVAQFELELDDTLAVPCDRLSAASATAAAAAEDARGRVTSHYELRGVDEVASEISQLADELQERLKALYDPREAPSPSMTVPGRPGCQRKVALGDCNCQIETMVKPAVPVVKAAGPVYSALEANLERLEAYRLAMTANEAARASLQLPQMPSPCASPGVASPLAPPAPPPRSQSPRLPERVDSKTALSTPRALPLPPSPTHYSDSGSGKDLRSVMSWVERQVNRRSKRRIQY